MLNRVELCLEWSALTDLMFAGPFLLCLVHSVFIDFGCCVCRLTWHEPSRKSVKGSWLWQCLSWKMPWLPWIQSRRLTSPTSASWATHPAPSSLSWRLAIFSMAGHIAALTAAEGPCMNGLQNSIESTVCHLFVYYTRLWSLSTIG